MNDAGEKITYQDIVNAVAELEEARSPGPYFLMPSRPLLGMMRVLFTEKEIEDIYRGTGIGWDMYLEVVRDE